MNEDFNPLDLSAVPKKIEEPVQPKEIPRPKATVQRVSMGPIFHSRITKVLALLLGLVLAALIGYSATSYYLSTQKQTTSIQNYFV